MKFGLPDLVGTVGVLLLMGTYLFLQLGRLESNTLIFSTLNALGSCLIVISLLFNFNLAAFVIEAFWIIISLIGIVRTIRNRAENP